LEAKQLATFIKTDEGSITVPKGIDLGALVNKNVQGQVYLYVDNLQTVEDDMKIRPLSVNLQQSASGANSWEIVTSVDRQYLDDLMGGLSQVVITIQKPVSPSPSPSPQAIETYSAIDLLSPPLPITAPTKAALSASVITTEI
jgi:hypothetical protein